MESHIPGYYPKFRCLAGRCPHTCCAWWEVPVDRESAAFYRSLPGALGKKLRAALVPDREGGVCFRLTGGACPFLDEAGLCSLQLQYGHSRIPAICREHPRFSYDYGPVREVGLCASCPEAARLILTEDFSFSVKALPGEGEEEADPVLLSLLSARDTALALLRAEVPLPQRLQALLLLGNDLQSALDEGDTNALEALCRVYEDGIPILDAVSLPPRWESLRKVLERLKSLEVLQPDWTALLDAALSHLAQGRTLPRPPDPEGGRAASYFLYRHWLRALNDGDLLTWCELAVLGTEVAGALSALVPGGFPESFRRFCLEVEHSQPNLNALQDALCHSLTLPDLLSLSGG